MEASIDLAAAPGSVPLARRFVRVTLSAWGLPALEYQATLLASELVTNALLHARSDMSLQLRSGEQALRVQVRDQSPVLPAQRHFSTASTTGRGLLLIERLAADWGSEPLGDQVGKVVWCDLLFTEPGVVGSGTAEDWLAAVDAL